MTCFLGRSVHNIKVLFFLKRTMSSSKSHINWTPLELLKPSNNANTGFIQLNVPLEPIGLFTLLWNNAKLRLLTDGAANRVYNCLEIDRDKHIPHIINGDFDSAKAQILDYYKSKGTEILPTPDQDATDFTKGLRILVERIKQDNIKINSIVVHDSISGRLDQVLSNINTLYTAEEITDIPLYSVTSTSISCLLQPGKHEIAVSSPKRGDWCSLVPIGGKCAHVSTTGLKWNLNNDAMEFGGLISTSNTFTESDTVTVETDKHLLWSMGVMFS